MKPIKTYGIELKVRPKPQLPSHPTIKKLKSEVLELVSKMESSKKH